MIKWAKRIGIAILGALTAYAALRAAQKLTGHKDAEKKWQSIAEDEVKSGLDGSVTRANQAFEKAKQHGAKALEAERQVLEKHEKQVKLDESMETIADRWRKSGGMRQ